ncbi:hypothetical protein [Ruicaihuangia caeni]|uniref:Uncharacterized protein n=1 Tax=Ruicaihuangia caeni TaxID=3042517 RepID=A0AAW6TDD4_9MICO|nr:hypothetical protein [Klugiella sp. YN-L-19]MDI2099077.1 hypothetical protein [Klugiella sp. YN-L-19]
MAGDLSVRVGALRVTPEAIALHRDALASLAATARRAALGVTAARRGLSMVEGRMLAQYDIDVVSRATPPADAGRAYVELDAASHAVRRCSEQSDELVERLRTVTAVYSAAESGNHRMLRLVQGAVAATLGAIAPLLGILLARVLLPPAIAVAWLSALAPDRMTQTLAERRDLINSVFFVEAVRATVMASDDAAAGLLGVPPAVIAALGDQGIGITGVASTAALITAIAQRTDWLRETPVQVRRTAVETVAPPKGLEERVARIPSGGREQVRVERYESRDGQSRYEVYIGGTVDGSPKARREAWDMTSNVHALAAGSPASLRGVEEALARAGATAADPIVVTGYSQGALVGALLATSGAHNVEALIEVGGPSGQVPVPDTVNRVRLDHTTDVVPALGGDASGEHTLRLMRDPLVDGIPADDRSLLPAHSLELYAETAAMADRSRHPDIETRLAGIDAARPAAEGQATSWRVDRSVIAGARSGAAQAR